MGSKSAIGIGNGICFKQVRDKGGGSYIDPLVRDSLVGVWIADQNTNESPTRNIIKNTIKDKGGDLELLNFGYKLNSGYGKYEEDFSDTTRWEVVSGVNKKPYELQVTTAWNPKIDWIALIKGSGDLKSVSLNVSGIPNEGTLFFYYGTDSIQLYNGNNKVTLSGAIPQTTSGYRIIKGRDLDWSNLVITQIPSFEGALVTDGKDDLITSTKTVKEMLGGSNKVTVVSMIHQIGLSSLTTINNIRSESVAHVVCRNICSSAGKTGIYGYSKQINTNNPPTLINNILGDKEDYTAEGNTALDPTDKFFVQGYKYRDSISEVSPIAYYWTFISNKALTTDQINQVISYFNLDKHVKPDVYYDVKKQGLSNDTPEADWYLKDFSGNGHDMQLYNFAKKLGSGIGKYEVDYSTWTKTAGVISTPFGLKITEPTHNYWILYTSNITVPAHKVKISGIPEGGEFRYLGIHILKNGINELPKMEEHPSAIGFTLARGTTQPSDWVGLSVEQIPDYEGALVSDGINDYGYADNLPIYKDYTVVADYARLKYGVIDSAIVSKSYIVNNGAFAFNLASGISPKNVSVISFGVDSPQIQNDDNYRKIRYQSKYINDSVNISAGTGIDSDKLWISCLRENKAFSESALYSILLFPYTLSEFLIERQLKRYKLGTLYPDMVEFRPIINVNIGKTYNVFKIRRTDTNELLYYYINGSVPNNKIGSYLPKGTNIQILVKWDNNRADVTQIKFNGKEYELNRLSDNSYYIDVTLDKSPQKIDIYADEYIRYEDIVQPYPAIINLKQDGKTITWGDKLKVGSDIVFVGSANLLPELYTVSETRYNGVTLYPNTIIKVEKSMVFDNARTYLKANEPSCILSPNRLRIPNSSYKILKYIPDLTGKGNHGRLNNFAYTEESGANEDGSIRFDGTDDHITIPTLSHGSKCMLMKVNWNKDDLMLYDQRRDNNPNSFAIYIPNFNNEDSIAYSSRNDGKTYIDGVLNTSVKGSQLKDVTHNITITNSNPNNDNTVSPAIGSNAKYNAFYAQMALFDFMLFPEISSENEIKELNDVMGIEGGYVESPNYYYDAYGKKNTDTDRNLIADQVSKDVANALEVKNVAYNSESGYTDDNGLLLDGVEDHAINTAIPAVTDFTVIAKRTDLRIIDDLMSSFIQKGLSAVWNAGGAFSEGRTEADRQFCSTFGNTNNISNVYNKEFFYETKNSYNGKAITIITDKTDSNGLSIGAAMNNGSALGGYWKGVFYKLMFYTKTIDQLSINMLKNLFERDELIDITNPIFKKKEL